MPKQLARVTLVEILATVFLFQGGCDSDPFGSETDLWQVLTGTVLLCIVVVNKSQSPAPHAENGGQQAD